MGHKSPISGTRRLKKFATVFQDSQTLKPPFSREIVGNLPEKSPLTPVLGDFQPIFAPRLGSEKVDSDAFHRGFSSADPLRIVYMVANGGREGRKSAFAVGNFSVQDRQNLFS